MHTGEQPSNYVIKSYISTKVPGPSSVHGVGYVLAAFSVVGFKPLGEGLSLTKVPPGPKQK